MKITIVIGTCMKYTFLAERMKIQKCTKIVFKAIDTFTWKNKNCNWYDDMLPNII